MVNLYLLRKIKNALRWPAISQTIIDHTYYTYPYGYKNKHEITAAQALCGYRFLVIRKLLQIDYRDKTILTLIVLK